MPVSASAENRGPRRAGPWHVLALALALVGCSADGGAVDPSLPRLPIEDPERNEEGRVIVVISEEGVADWPDRLTRLPAGPVPFLIKYPGPHDTPEGDIRPPLALWIRGRGSARPFRTEAASGVIRPDTMEDWDVELAPGAYELSVSLGSDPGRAAVVLAF